MHRCMRSKKQTGRGVGQGAEKVLHSFVASVSCTIASDLSVMNVAEIGWLSGEQRDR